MTVALFIIFEIIMFAGMVAAIVVSKLDEKHAETRAQAFRPQIWKPRQKDIVWIKQGQFTEENF